MLLRSISTCNGEDLVEVQGGATAAWHEQAVRSAMFHLSILPKWCACASEGEPSMFIKVTEMRKLAEFLSHHGKGTSMPVPYAQPPAQHPDCAEVVLQLPTDTSVEILRSTFPNEWLVKDIIVAFTVSCTALREKMGSYGAPAVQVADADSGVILDVSSRLDNVTNLAWTVVSATPDSFCILRGFPFRYELQHVKGFMLHNGVRPQDIAQVCLQRRGASHRFTGLAFVAWRPGVSSKVYDKKLHRKAADERYIEVLPRHIPTARPVSSRSTRRTTVQGLLTATRPLWWQGAARAFTSAGQVHPPALPAPQDLPTSVCEYRTRSNSPVGVCARQQAVAATLTMMPDTVAVVDIPGARAA
jgi:hypothetical protein